MSEDIYTTPEPTDDTYETLPVSDPENDYETLPVSAPENTAQHGGFKKNFFKAVAACVGLLLLAGIIVLGILNLDLTKQRDWWKTSYDGFQTRHDNLTELRDQLLTRLNNLTELRDQLLTRHDNLTEQRDQLLTRLNTTTEQRDQWKTSYDEFLSRHTELKRIHCESHGFTFGDGVCYYYPTEEKNWENSRAFCRARQSDLMTIKSREKQDFVDRVVEVFKPVWIGLTDSETEGVWKWVDGTPLTTTFWQPGQPNDLSIGSDCAALFYRDFIGGGGWLDLPCSLKCRWICEIVF